MDEQTFGGGRTREGAAQAPASLEMPAALGRLRQGHLRAIAWARVGVNTLVTAAYLRAVVAGGNGWYAPAALRILLLVAAAQLLLDVAHVSGGRDVALAVRRAEDELRARLAAAAASVDRSRRDLLDAQARAESFAQLVIHDLRSPLAVVLANLGLAIEALARSPDHLQEAESLQIAEGEAVRLSGMIGDLLLVPRLEGGALTGQFTPTTVRELLDAAATSAGTRAQAKEIRIDVLGPRELVASLDPSLVRRMLDNLAGNAIRHTPRGGRIELAARIERDRLRIAVRNTGEPVAGSVRARLFQKYATLGGSDAQRSGLGLYLCRLVAEAHGGDIALVDRPGWSVSFEADLPLRTPGTPLPVDENPDLHVVT